jgi:hypothetical protein
LVSNGVRHARTPLELILRFDGSCLRIALSDQDPRPPVAEVRHELTEGGSGLSLIETLSTNWGTDLDDARGKTVRLEIDTTVIQTPQDIRPLSLRRGR